MSIEKIVEQLDTEIARLEQARKLLSNGSRLDTAKLAAATRKGSAKNPHTRKRTLSLEARQKIAEAQRKRWAAQRKAAK